ncbi:unnamed protein product [Schistosoma mattheei]|uniref:Uncharacterized protein n=1 Tax=Schistosoma mattheei TaxID=31246 RepID=A0A183PA94_9TREM|nr:unnamed protein product [Schistosoma mattheei]
MVVEGIQQETLDPGFVLPGTSQQGVHQFPQDYSSLIQLIAIRLISQNEENTMNRSSLQIGVPVILRELVLVDEFDPVSSSLIFRVVTTGLSGPRPNSCRTEM